MIAVVTGGTSGIGFEISKQFILRGDSVIAIYNSNDAKAEKAKAEINSERFITKKLDVTKDIANMVLFLCSEKSDYITGENININGGILLV